MKHWFLPLAFLFAIPANAAITFVRAAQNTSAVSTTVVTMTVTGSDTVVVCTNFNPAATTVVSVVDTGLSTYTFRVGITEHVNGITRTECWSTAAGGAVSSSAITVTFSGAIANSVVAGDYAGVVALGTTATSDVSNTSPITVSLVTQDANNFVVAGNGTRVNGTLTANTGSQRTVAHRTSTALALCDNTAASATTVTCATSNDSPTDSAAAALELRSTSGGGVNRLRGTVVN